MTDSAPELLAYAATRVPWLRKLAADPRREPEPGRSLYQPEWLAARVADTAHRWKSDETATNATLWWYATAYRLIGVGVTTALVTGRAVAWDPADELWLRPNGYFGGFTPHRHVAPEAYADTVMESLSPAVRSLSLVGELDQEALWRLCADAVSGRALTAASAVGSVGRCSTYARDVVTAMGRRVALEAPVFVDQIDFDPAQYAAAGSEPAPGASRSVLRTECCHLHTTPNHARCKRCPGRRRRM